MASTSGQDAPLGCLAVIGGEKVPLDWYVLFKPAGRRTLIGFASKAAGGNVTPENAGNKGNEAGKPEGEDPENKSGEAEKPKGEDPENKSGEAEKPKGEDPENKSGEAEKPKGEDPENKSGQEKKNEENNNGQKKAERKDSLTEITVTPTSNEDTKDPLYATLKKLLEEALPDESLECRKPKQNGISYVMFNDQLPTSPGFTTGGSSKGIDLFPITDGVIAFKGDSGFFLTHSAPGFPKAAKKYEWPDHLTRQAHLFVCLNVDKQQLEYIAERLVYASPLIYASSFGQEESNGPLERLRKGEITVMPRPVSTVQQKKKPPTAFIFKHQSFNTDLASEVAEALERPLIVFSGTSATRSDRLDIVCKKGRSIEHVSGTVTINGTAWLPHAGGASWAVSKSKDMFCLLSQGRTVDAEIQSGMAVCLYDKPGNITSLLAPKNTRITGCK